MYVLRYREKVSHVSKAYRDQPMSPLDKAVYWSEYVIRHRGAPHMRSTAMDLNFVQYHNLDVWLILAITAFLSSFVLIGILKWICSKCYKSKTEMYERSTAVDKKHR